jgi:DNA-binding CsgD family transcriptional regulator
MRIPDRLHETIRRHIDSLHEKTGLMLRVAALIGERFTFSLLKERMTVNSAEDEIVLIRSIHEAKRAGLLRLDGDNIVFRNPLVWQSLAEGGGVLAQDGCPGEPAPAESPAAIFSTEISPMQRRIAELASEGKTNRQIARQLFISPHTVDTHLRRIFRKLNISSRIELTRIFIAEHL